MAYLRHFLLFSRGNQGSLIVKYERAALFVFCRRNQILGSMNSDVLDYSDACSASQCYRHMTNDCFTARTLRPPFLPPDPLFLRPFIIKARCRPKPSFGTNLRHPAKRAFVKKRIHKHYHFLGLAKRRDGER
jgi:hypothetical protein